MFNIFINKIPDIIFILCLLTLSDLWYNQFTLITCGAPSNFRPNILIAAKTIKGPMLLSRINASNWQCNYFLIYENIYLLHN